MKEREKPEYKFKFNPNVHKMIPVAEMKGYVPEPSKFNFYFACDGQGPHTLIVKSDSGDTRIMPLRLDAVVACGGMLFHRADTVKTVVLAFFDERPPGTISIPNDKSLAAIPIPDSLPLMRFNKRTANGKWKTPPFYDRLFNEVKNKLVEEKIKNGTQAKCVTKQQMVISGKITHRHAERIISKMTYDIMGVLHEPYAATAARFTPAYRYPVYLATCLHGERMRQFCETFPVAVLLSINSVPTKFNVVFGSQSRPVSGRDACSDKYPEVVRAVVDGASPKMVAEILHISHAYIKMKPQAACLIAKNNILRAQSCQSPPVIPVSGCDSAKVQCDKIKISESLSSRNRNSGKLALIGRRMAEELGPRHGSLIDKFNHIVDWADGHEEELARLDRHFSWHRMDEMIREWEGTFNNPFRIRLEHAVYPPQWFPDDEFKIGKGRAAKKYSIFYIADSSSLSREGAEMHHCVGGENYHRRVIAGESQIYSVKDGNGKGVATIEVRKAVGGRFSIAQCRGPCNGDVPPPIKKHIDKHFASIYQENEIGEPCCVNH